MEKKMKILFTTLVILPMAWSIATAAPAAPKPSDEADLKAGLPGPGASPAYTIPAEDSKVAPWFADTVRKPRQRNGLEPDLREAEAKAAVVRVRQDGSGHFKSIQKAVESVEAKGNENRVIIDLGSGVYREKVTIDRYRPYITLYGDPEHNPTIVFNASSPKYQTMDTPTLAVQGDYFSCVNVRIENDAELKESGAGIALRVTGNYASFYNTTIVGKKGTLLDDEGKHFFMDCVIEGGDDIIFGDGRSIYLSTKISVLPHSPTSIITAQARKNTDPRGGGFVFAHCLVNKAEENVKALLGRTYMAGSRVVFAYSFMNNIIEPKGWFDNFETDYEKTAVFGEYKNVGPGSDTSKRIKQPCTKPLTDNDVKPYLSLDFIDAGEWLLPPPFLDEVTVVKVKSSH